MRTFFAAAIALLVTASPLGAAPCPGFTLVSARSTVGSTPSRVAAADFNGDGKKDIVVANLNASTVSVLFGNGDGTFGTRTNLTAGSGADGVTVGDFDKDGDIDIAVAVASGNYASVFLNNGNGTFATRVRYFLPSGTESAAAITTADVNNDNKLDLVVSYADFAAVDGIAVMLGNGNGTFAAATEFPSGGAGPRDVATGDFNGDGKLDIVSANDGTGTDSLSVYLGNGDGTFGAATNYSGVVDPFRVTAVDVDGDGKVDIISAQHGPDDGDIAVLKGNGSGAFAAAVHYASGNLYDLALADFDSDGKLDAASPSVDYNQTFVHPGLAGGAFGTAATYLSGPSGTLFYPYGIAAVDLNGDGSLDLAVANYNTNDVSVLLNNCTTQPSITTVAPAGGVTAGGTNVVLTGANLSGATSVKFGGTAASITANTATTINVTTPAHAAGAVDVVAIVTTGTATKTNGFTYADPPTVSSINPTSGPAAGGQTGVVITGTNLSAVTNVKLGGTNATITNTTATTVTITTPAHAAGAVDVVVTNPAGSATLTNGYTYIAAPTVTSVSPNAGPIAGGQTGVLVNGTNFTGATGVTFGGTAATVTNVTATQITVTTPVHAAGAVAVAVTTPGGTGTQNNAYTYAAAPTATSVTPGSGPTAGGQTGVAIAGTGLSTASAVTFDGVAATITNKTSTSVTVTTPAHATGAVNVVVTTGGGSATIANGYTYVEAPTLAGVSPNAGPTAGGQTGVVLTGTNLTGATQVRFGTTSATITNVTATAVTVTTPARSAGTVNVSVTTPGGTATATNAYTYVSAPTATGVAPNAGPAAGGQTGVVISGTNLSNATGVTFGGTSATITNNGSTSITVTTPAHAAGAVNVVVTTAGGSATRTNAYTYIDAPSIASLSPASGPVSGGQSVTINGSALANASSVKFDGLTAAITNNTAGAITVTTPQHAAPGAVSVVVTTPGGTGSSTYTYVAGPATHFAVSAPATATAGTPFSATVTALDAFENVATGYAGSVHFTSSDGTATLPADSALTNGVGTFSATLRVVGAQSIAVADGAITGNAAINVNPGPAAVLDASAPSTATAGVPYSLSVTISDAFGNRITSYAGTVHFTATDATATLPADSPVGGGQQSFSATLRTAGAQTVTVTDGTLTDSATTTVAPGPTASFVLTGPSAATAGIPVAFDVTAKDAFHNTTPAYAGTVHFTSSDGTATLPADSTLTNGTASFNATLRIAGEQTLTATDNAITGSLPINVSPAAASQLIVSAPANATAGVPIAFTVTARDAFNNVATGYAATLHFTSTDASATLPANSTLTNGTASFNATLRTTGAQTIAAGDGSLSGNASIQVGAAAPTHFTVSAPATTIAGNPFSVTVTARDAFENVVTGYAGTVHFTSSDPNATLPGDGPLTNGAGTFGATLRTIGARTIAAADGPISGSAPITVNAGPATHFAVAAPPIATAGVPFTFTVTALDAFQNPVAGYAGTVHFTSSDANATLPTDSMLTNGSATFNATLRTAGSHAITAADGAITGSTVVPVQADVATHFALSAPATTIAGNPFAFTVTALDAYDNVAIAYSGNAHFTSSDPNATLPGDSALVNGNGSFNATLRTAGPRTITATDGAIAGSAAINVDPALTATHFTVSAPANVTAGNPLSVTVTARDAFENIATGYTGSVHFTSSDGTPTLPADGTLTSGTRTFSATLRTTGPQSITAADGPITGSASINVTASATTHFAVSAPANTTAGSPFAFTVTALDAFDNVAVTYGGTVHLTATDGNATLPADSTLTNGVGSFNATLRTTGAHTLTAAEGAITGNAPVSVAPAAATHFTVTAAPSAVAGSPFAFTVTARDAFENVATAYAGTAHFTASDAAASLPSDSALPGGVGSFSATFRTAGTHLLTAADGSITGNATIAVSPAATDHFTVAAPANTTAGVPFNVTVTAFDAFDNVTFGYAGNAHFTSSDGAATLPADSALTNGAGTFGVTLRTAGPRTIAAADGAITGNASVNVSPAAATHFSVAAPASVTAGATFPFTVTALDTFNNVAVGYAGNAHFTAADANATLPGDSALTNGVGSFNATLRTAGSRSIAAADGAIAGNANVEVSPAAATHFSVSAPASVTAGSAFDITVTALDTFENVATAYAGTAHFTSTDGAATLPGDSPLTNGSRTFSATLRTTGAQSIASTDGAITGSRTLDVNAAPATHFLIVTPTTATAGAPFSFSVTALDAFENTATDYAGTVHFTATDASATLPTDSTLTGGVGSFNATLRTAGPRTITAADSLITDTSAPINVSASEATQLVVAAPASSTAGSAFDVTVTALDAFGNTATAFSDAIHFTSSDAQATLHADGPLTNGSGMFSTTLATAGAQTITATANALTGQDSVNVNAGAATQLVAAAPSNAIAGVPITFTVTARDAFNNVDTSFAEVAHFTSSDATATLPADVALANGTGSFSATLRIAGPQTITAATAKLNATTPSIDVTAAAADHFTLDAPATAVAGNAFNVTLTARDAFNNPTKYVGNAHYTATDATATLPADGALTGSATLRIAGAQTITATDGALTGSAPITVTAAAATHFDVTAPSTATAGVAFSVTVVARDAFQNIVAYAGPAHFTSTDPAATLPADGTLTGNAALRTANTQTITATDGALTGSASIDVSAAAATSLSIDPIANQTAGVAFALHAVAHDAFGNVATGFSGNAALATNDGPISPATLPFSAGIADANVTLTRAGAGRTITAAQASISGASNAFDVAAGPLDHFHIEAAAGGAIGAQTTGVPFAIRITALDAFGNVVPTFTGTATITSTGSLTSGGTTAPFVAGLLANHNLTLGGNGPVTITVSAGQVSTTSAPFAVGALADLSLQLSGSLFAEAGGNVDYTLIVRNAGPSTAHAPVVLFALPSGWPLASSSAPCASGFPCALPDLAPNATATITITANTPLGADGAYPISASVSSTSPDNSPANNQTSISTTVSTTAEPCPPAPTLMPAAIAEVSSGAMYHVSWGDAGVANYEWQESTDASFTGATVTMTNATSIAFRHDVTSATAFFYRVRPVIPCLGVLPFSNAVRVVVQPRTSDGASVELMVETGSTDKLTQTVHVEAPRGATSVTPFAFVARSDQPWLDVSPVSGGIPPTGIDLTLTISASARPIGTSVATATLLSDGIALAGLRVNLHVAPPMTVEPRTAPVPANASLIPGVAHAPSAGVLWQSDVRLLNASGKATKYGLSFTPSGESGATSGRRVELDVPAGAAVALDDVVRHFFGYGALAGESALGALDIRPSDPNARTVVTSRTYAVTPNGTYGQSIPAMSAPSFAGPGATLSLQHLAQSAAFRTNVGLAEVSGQPAAVRLRVLDDAGRELAHTDITLAAFEQRQYNSLLADLGVTANDARIEMAVTSTTGRIAAYASVVDNITADPTLIPGAPPAAIHARRYIVPGVADFDTGRNNWRSDLRIFNASQASAMLTVSFLPQGGGAPIARAVTIAPGEVKAYDSILRTLFDITGNGGAVHITSASDATLVVTARTYDATANGTYGQFIPAVTAPEATALGERPLEILHIEQTNAYRANIGFVEVAGQPATVEVVATLPDGRTASTTLDLAAFEFRQLTSMLAMLGLDGATNARLTLRVIGGNGRVTGYASIIDNRTGDPTYMSAQ